MKIIRPSVEFITPMDEESAWNTMKRLELIGRTCYKSEDRITDASCIKFLECIIRRGHESVIEHASVTVKFICDRGVSHEIVRHRRLYGDERESMDWIPYLRHIARRPRSLRNSGIYGMMPEVMQEYMDRCESSERGKVLKVLAELTERSGFDSALNTVSEAVRLHATDPDSLQSLYRRIYTDVPLLPPLEAAEGIPPLKVIRFPDDLTGLDAVLRGGAANG